MNDNKKYLAQSTSAIFITVVAFAAAVAALPACASTELWQPYFSDSAKSLVIVASPNYDDVSCSGVIKKTTAPTQSKDFYTYEAGVKLERRLPDSGALDFDLVADPRTSTYGAGSGFKSFVRFFEDSNNHLDFGFVRNKKIQRKGYTVMVEGVINGQPVATYWKKQSPPRLISGPAHHIHLQWGNGQISFLVDKAENSIIQYSMHLNAPDVSFLCAARRAGDRVSSNFDNISFSGIDDPIVQEPSSQPRAYIQADVSFSGLGEGYATYLNLHDNFSNAVAFGFQSDKGDRNSNGKPTLHENRVVNGTFTHKYFASTYSIPQAVEQWKLAYFEDEQLAIFYRNGVAVAGINVALKDRVFFQAEVNGKSNGDSVNAAFSNVRIGGVWNDGTVVIPNGAWNSADFNFWGLQANTLNSNVNNATFTIGGIVTGLPAGADWDNIESINNGRYAGQPVGAIVMITEWWHGQ